LVSMIKQLKLYALAYQTQLNWWKDKNLEIKL
jgi:hypothetical protein